MGEAEILYAEWVDSSRARRHDGGRMEEEVRVGSPSPTQADEEAPMAAGRTLSLFDDAPRGGWQQGPSTPERVSARALLRRHLELRRAGQGASDGIAGLLKRAGRAVEVADLEAEVAKAALALDRGEFFVLVGDQALLSSDEEAVVPEGCEPRLVLLLPLAVGS